MTFERETVDGVAVVRLARPPVNALDLPTILALEIAFGRLADERPAGLVLSGAGGRASRSTATPSTVSRSKVMRCPGFPGSSRPRCHAARDASSPSRP